MLFARAGIYNAAIGGQDYSEGAYHWEGMINIFPKNETVIFWGVPISIQTNKSYNPKNWFIRKGFGEKKGPFPVDVYLKSKSGKINYLETRRSGSTIFFINNPELHGKRAYP